MRKKRRLYNFLIFSMCILIFLVILLICKEEGLYKKSETVSKTKNGIENNLVQGDIKEEQKIKRETREIYHVQNEEPIQEVEEETSSISYDNLIVNSEDYNSNFVNAVIKQLSYIPTEILIDFENKGWKICIASEEEICSKLGEREARLYSKDEGQFLKGYTKINDKTIYLTYNSITLRDNTIIHEIGHYYDIENAWASCTEEYRNIYEKEKSSLNSTTTQISSNRELFAETFEYVILEETGYENLETYQYVKDIIYHN